MKSTMRPTSLPSSFTKADASALVGAPEQCTLAVGLPRELTYAEGKKLSQNLEAASDMSIAKYRVYRPLSPVAFANPL